MSDLLYDVVAAGFRLSFRLEGWPIDARGQEHVPLTGPAILASNHVGYIDFSFVALSQRRRRVRFMIRSDVMHVPVIGAGLRRMGQIEVDPYGDPEPGYRAARAQLEAGEVVGVFPEGTISPSFVPMPARTGAARLAAETGAPILPCAVWGSHRIITKGRPRNFRRGTAVVVRYGAPFTVEPDVDVHTATAELMARIAVLLKECQEVYPQRPRGPHDTWWVPAHLGGTAPTVDEGAAIIARQVAERRRRARGDGGG